ncbi:MAG TPA: protein kinase [Terriglobales bacterium]|nr:protein kinase [Terriglobales bacterium]
MWWDRLARSFRAARKRPDPGEARLTPTTASSQGQTPRYLSPSGSAHPDLQGAATVAVVRRPRRPAKAARSLARGQTVAGRFRILRFLNSGGMGEVFEAWDSELGERVALKTIRSEIASLSSVIERFKQEVRQARGISHVNVCRVYEVFSHLQDSGERVWFLTMELLEGQTLAERLRQQGPIPAAEALGLVEQMVAGLAAAHELGVVHRDFKSGNVMLVDARPGQTRAVVTDFGLAFKVLTDQHADPEEAKQGTPRYMAPEQVLGGEVGFAADQYALGVVMCEMLTGESPGRSDPAAGGEAILPAGHNLSPRWETVLRRCLEFRPEDRFPQIRDVAAALNPVRHSKVAWVMGTAAVLASVLAGYTLLTRGDRGDRVENVTQLTPDTDLTGRPSLSRDGTMIAYSSNRAENSNLDIWVQHLPSSPPRRLTTDPAEDVDPHLAPDGSAVVFRSERNGGGIYLVDTAGGGERMLVPDGRNPRFSPDGHSIAYWVGDYDRTVASGRLFLLSLTDGSVVQLAADFKDARSPVWSSDGRHLIFIGCRAGDKPMPACSEWWAISRDGRTLKETGGLARLHAAQVEAIDEIGGWYGDALLFNGRQGPVFNLWELKIPQATLRAEGQPHPLTNGEAREVAPSLAEEGTIAFERLTAALHIWRIEHASDPDGAVATKMTHDAASDVTPSVSPNGRWLVFPRGFGVKKGDIWIKDLQSGSEALLLSSAMDKLSPLVDDTGKTVAFEGREDNVPSLFAETEGQPPRRLSAECDDPTGWFDGTRGVLCRQGSPSKIKMVDLDSGRATTLLEQAGYSLSEANWSSRSQYLLFTAAKNGTTKQVFAVALPQSEGSTRGRWIPITGTNEVSDRPRWSGDGRTIFYLSNRDGSLCVWGQHFDPRTGKTGPPFAAMHYHNPHFSPHVVVERTVNLSVAGDTIYLNVGEINTSVWIGRLRRSSSFFSFLRRPR